MPARKNRPGKAHAVETTGTTVTTRVSSNLAATRSITPTPLLVPRHRTVLTARPQAVLYTSVSAR